MFCTAKPESRDLDSEFLGKFSISVSSPRTRDHSACHRLETVT
jgi:hypothetical protein